MNRHLDRTYEHYVIGEECSEVVKSEVGARAVRLAEYKKRTEASDYIAPGIEVPLTSLQQEIADDARAFVTDTTGIMPDCPVRMFTRIEKRNQGSYVPVRNEIAAVVPLETNDYLLRLKFGALLAHEFTHATGHETVGIMHIANIVTGAVTSRIRPAHDDRLVTPSFRGDVFFEEALAEEVASRWREAVRPTPRGADRYLMQSGSSPALPARMFTYEGALQPAAPTDLRNYITAYPAFGVQILSEYTGVDIFALLANARQPELQMASVAELRRTIDNIEPGFYDMLLATQYNYDSFTGSLAHIKQAIASHAHQERYNGVLAVAA